MSTPSNPSAEQPPVALAARASPSKGDSKLAHPPHHAWLSTEPWKDEAALGTLAQAARTHYTLPELGSSGEPVPGDDSLKFFSGAFCKVVNTH